MKTIKQNLCILLVCVLFSGFISYGTADLTEVKAIQKTVHMSVGKNSSATQDVLFLDNRIYVPIRFVSEALGLHVDWNSNKHQLTIHTEPSFTDFDEADPLNGERFVYGEILSINEKNRLLTIEEHYDDQYIHTEPHLFVSPEAVVILQRNDKVMNLDFKDLKIGDVVGMVLNKEGEIRGIILNN
ncbi:stalk domain-containing protein [Geosporobacter ferrireducens]|uniref:Copper amine oxidase-like N-terminal domain-containing protein n=1 Tax=Geosporobacter ferrireducens TaxID=1424294 RepID=A0A1D8GLE9_9FIRM|nr:stalk domain-containing protein [Geosporobacter ferrireducens]AOT71737.1 hypothetical protein Gferi_20685 [Geosporobacter ferrireducens]MTI55518.1 hypothetical protein [Geosporobacter ferrireducens]